MRGESGSLIPSRVFLARSQMLLQFQDEFAQIGQIQFLILGILKMLLGGEMEVFSFYPDEGVEHIK